MELYGLLIAVCWVVFIAYWIISAFKAKRTVYRSWASVYLRLAIIIVIIVLLNIPTSREFIRSGYIFLSLSPFVRSLGVLLCLAGIALAVWARVYLGRNWGMPMSLKENPELVTSGPYSYIRHPIYTGMLTAVIGSILADGLFWLVPLIILTVYFIYGAIAEEKLMTREFPNQYPEYKKRTKMLIPFIF